MDSDQDIEIEFIDKDSGMSSLGGSKDETPERRVIIEDLPDEDNEQQIVRRGSGSAETYDEEPDESLSERLWGLTEMFPESIRNVCGAATDLTTATAKTVFSFSCSASWIFFTSSMILFAPVIFETERAQMEEMQRSQQKQVLLGPGSAMSASGGMPMPPMPASR